MSHIESHWVALSRNSHCIGSCRLALRHIIESHFWVQYWVTNHTFELIFIWYQEKQSTNKCQLQELLLFKETLPILAYWRWVGTSEFNCLNEWKECIRRDFMGLEKRDLKFYALRLRSLFASPFGFFDII